MCMNILLYNTTCVSDMCYLNDLCCTKCTTLYHSLIYVLYMQISPSIRGDGSQRTG